MVLGMNIWFWIDIVNCYYNSFFFLFSRTASFHVVSVTLKIRVLGRLAVSSTLGPRRSSRVDWNVSRNIFRTLTRLFSIFLFLVYRCYTVSAVSSVTPSETTDLWNSLTASARCFPSLVMLLPLTRFYLSKSPLRSRTCVILYTAIMVCTLLRGNVSVQNRYGLLSDVLQQRFPPGRRFKAEGGGNFR